MLQVAKELPNAANVLGGIPRRWRLGWSAFEPIIQINKHVAHYHAALRGLAKGRSWYPMERTEGTKTGPTNPTSGAPGPAARLNIFGPPPLIEGEDAAASWWWLGCWQHC